MANYQFPHRNIVKNLFEYDPVEGSLTFAKDYVDPHDRQLYKAGYDATSLKLFWSNIPARYICWLLMYGHWSGKYINFSRFTIEIECNPFNPMAEPVDVRKPIIGYKQSDLMESDHPTKSKPISIVKGISWSESKKRWVTIKHDGTRQQFKQFIEALLCKQADCQMNGLEIDPYAAEVLQNILSMGLGLSSVTRLSKKAWLKMRRAEEAKERYREKVAHRHWWENQLKSTLVNRNGIWYTRFQIKGKKFFRSCGTEHKSEAECVEQEIKRKEMSAVKQF